MTKSEAIPSAGKSINYSDFKTSRINPNYNFIKTDKMESGIAQTLMVLSSNFEKCDITRKVRVEPLPPGLIRTSPFSQSGIFESLVCVFIVVSGISILLQLFKSSKICDKNQESQN